jgi:hypothetical protein
LARALSTLMRQARVRRAPSPRRPRLPSAMEVATRRRRPLGTRRHLLCSTPGAVMRLARSSAPRRRPSHRPHPCCAPAARRAPTTARLLRATRPHRPQRLGITRPLRRSSSTPRRPRRTLLRARATARRRQICMPPRRRTHRRHPPGLRRRQMPTPRRARHSTVRQGSRCRRRAPATRQRRLHSRRGLRAAARLEAVVTSSKSFDSVYKPTSTAS